MKYMIGSCIVMALCFAAGGVITRLILKKGRGAKSFALKILSTLVIGSLLMAGISLAYLQQYSHAEPEALEALNDTEKVKVTDIDEGWLFDGSGNDNALVFYPGGKVQAEAYAPLMQLIAAGGVDCILVKMPFNMAIFGSGRMDDVMMQLDYEKWFIAGHSMGGTAASMYAADHSESLEGLILLASYPTSPLKDIRLLSVFGSEDGELGMETYAESRENWPVEQEEFCIDGGNHSQFGCYGLQKGDGKASISADEQKLLTCERIIEFIER